MIHETCSPWVNNMPYWFLGKRSRSWGIGDWKRFPDHNWLWNPPMIMKLHTPATYESKMCLIDFWVKGIVLLGIEIIQGCSMFIQRIFATLLFASLMHPLLVFFFLFHRCERTQLALSKSWIWVKCTYICMHGQNVLTSLQLSSIHCSCYNLRRLWQLKKES